MYTGNDDHSGTADERLARAMREVLRCVKSVNYGSVEIMIQNSRIVQIERKEKFHLDKIKLLQLLTG